MRNRHVTLRLKSDEYQTLDAAAAAEEQTVSEFIRRSLRLHPTYSNLKHGTGQSQAESWLAGQEAALAGDGRGGLSSQQKQALMALAEAGGSATVEDICRFSVDRRRFTPDNRYASPAEQKRLLNSAILPLIVAGLVEVPAGCDPLLCKFRLTARGAGAALVLVGADSF